MSMSAKSISYLIVCKLSTHIKGPDQQKCI